MLLMQFSVPLLPVSSWGMQVISVMILILLPVTPLLLLLLLLLDTVVATVTAAEIAGQIVALVGVIDAIDVGLFLFGLADHALDLSFGQQPLLLRHARTTAVGERLHRRFRFNFADNVAVAVAVAAVRVVLLPWMVTFGGTAVFFVTVRYRHATDNLSIIKQWTWE